MSPQQTVRITNVAGAQVAQFESVDPSVITGWELKCRLAEVMGFPSVSFSFVSTDGKQIDDSESLQGVLGQKVCEAEPISISCIVGRQKAVGAKSGEPLPRMSKAGELLCRRILRAEQSGKPVVNKLRIPDPALRDQAHKLICDSFAPELEGLIGVAVEAAYHQELGGDSTEARGQHVFRDAAKGLCADLSSCRLWMSVMDTELVGPRSSTHHQALQEGLVSAVLWRLLDGWTGASEDVLGEPVPAGPVLEVLFVATSIHAREWGEAAMLVAELEAVAGDMGCVAIAVAAVPAQGRAFWSRNGYTVQVPLAEWKESDMKWAHGSGPGLGEPASALGEFLCERMLLFNDTPLVAKVLKSA